ncbi:hypothetical protein V2J09_010382 [Rumex salicifolius]
MCSPPPTHHLFIKRIKRQGVTQHTHTKGRSKHPKKNYIKPTHQAYYTMLSSSFPDNYLHPNSDWHQQLQYQQQINQSTPHHGSSCTLPADPSGGPASITRPVSMAEQARLANRPRPAAAVNCPRCGSTNTKFCYYNNRSFSQPRHWCRNCRRHWTHGGTLRTIPVGGSRRGRRRPRPSTATSAVTPPAPPPALGLENYYGGVNYYETVAAAPPPVLPPFEFDLEEELPNFDIGHVDIASNGLEEIGHGEFGNPNY